MAWLALAANGACTAAPPLPKVPKQMAGRAARMQMMRLPLAFEANRGQFDKRARFVTRGNGATVFLTDSGAVMVLGGKRLEEPMTPGERFSPAAIHGTAPTRRGPGAVLRMRMIGASAAGITGLGKLPGTVNYFRGNDPGKWHTGIPTYARVRTAGVYPGTDLVYYGNQGRLEYDFIVKPGADPGRIRLAFEGADRLAVAANGNLVATTAAGDVVLKRPYAYQQVGGKRVQVACDYTCRPSGRTHSVSFRLARYDATRPLVVDPVLEYSTYLGGASVDYATGVAVDGAGCAYVTGITVSTDFPVTAGALATLGYDDAFVTKMDALGSGLVYSTYLGGASSDDGTAIAVDSAGRAYVTGTTFSTDYPTTPGALQAKLAGPLNCFVTRLGASGADLSFSTYLGGEGGDNPVAVAVDSEGSAFIAGSTNSTRFPLTWNGFRTTLYGNSDGFVVKLQPDGNSLAYGTFVGGPWSDSAFGLAVDNPGCAYVVGRTQGGIPVTPGALQGTYTNGTPYSNNYTGFLIKLNSTGSAPVYATYIGDSSNLSAIGISVDTSTCAYVVGWCQGGAPITAGSFDPSQGGNAAFAAKLDATGSQLVYGTYLGGSYDRQSYAQSVSVDSAGCAYVTGRTMLPTFPTTTGAFDTTLGGDADGFLTKLNPSGSALNYSTFIGGGDYDDVRGMAMDSTGAVYVVGCTSSLYFPVTPNAFTPHYSGNGDAFITKWRLRNDAAVGVEAAAGVPGGAVQLRARLVRAYSGAPLAGLPVTFTVDGAEAAGSPSTTDPSGWATLSYTIPADAALGAHTCVASFAGNDDFTECTGSAVLTVLAPTSLAVEAASGQGGDTVTLSACLKRTDTGVGLAGKLVAFKVGGSAAPGSPVTTGADGTATLDYTIPAGTAAGSYTLGAAFAADAEADAATGASTLTVKGAPTTLEASAPATTAAGASIRLAATLKLATTGAPVAGRKVSFVFNGLLAGNGTTDDTGLAQTWFRIPATTPAGAVPVDAAFAGDSAFDASSATASATVTAGTATTMMVNSPSAGAGASVTLYAYLWRTSDRYLLAGKPVTFSVDGIKVGTASTDSTGYAAVSYLVVPGTTGGAHGVLASFDGDATYTGCGIFGTLNVSTAWAATVSIPVRTGVRGQPVVLYAFVWRKYDGAMLAGKKVRFLVDGVEVGTGVSDSKGYAEYTYTIPAGAAAGNHATRGIFDGDGQYDPTQSTSTLTVNTRDELTWYVANVGGLRGNTVLLYVYLKSKLTGLPVSGRSVTLKVDGAAVGSGATDANGYAACSYAIPVDAALGTHSITGAFDGDATFNAGSASATLTVNSKDEISWYVANVTGARGAKVTLYVYIKSKGTGAALGGKSISFKVDGTVVGSGVSDANGYAFYKYTIPAGSTSGAHPILAEFAGDASVSAGSKGATLTVQ